MRCPDSFLVCQRMALGNYMQESDFGKRRAFKINAGYCVGIGFVGLVAKKSLKGFIWVKI